MLRKERGAEFPLSTARLAAGASVLALVAAFTVSAPQEVRADECLLDTENDGRVTYDTNATVEPHFDDATDGDGGATGSGNDQLACGVNASATGADSTAVGVDSTASALNSTAIGSTAAASGVNSTATGATATASGNNSTATGVNATASSTNATATGVSATASGVSSTATGVLATASGIDSTATGAEATASGVNATAMGSLSEASGDDSTALGAGANATFAGSTALGSGAVTAAVDEMMFGHTGNTYTTPGITSDLSRDRQSGPLQLLTTDAAGHLASDGGEVFGQLADLNAGVALAMALESPELTSSENFAMRFGYGNFEGDSHAFGLSMMGNLGLGTGNRWSWDASVGAGWSDFYSYDSGATWGGRAGVQVAW